MNLVTSQQPQHNGKELTTWDAVNRSLKGRVRPEFITDPGRHWGTPATCLIFSSLMPTFLALRGAFATLTGFVRRGMLVDPLATLLTELVASVLSVSAMLSTLGRVDEGPSSSVILSILVPCKSSHGETKGQECLCLTAPARTFPSWQHGNACPLHSQKSLGSLRRQACVQTSATKGGGTTRIMVSDNDKMIATMPALACMIPC